MNREVDGSSQPLTVVLLPWLPRLIGLEEGRKAELNYEYRAGETLRQFLARLAAGQPALGTELWDSAKADLRMPIEVAINGSVLGIHHHLDSQLQPGDEILLLPQYQGG
ncbi:MAG TPA: MoaD/ThiS family protein [Chloroflexota bacterium]|nr:MoaD/ThiS family protein [Chloroflexota bacterium]